MNEETTTILIDTALASGSASALDPEERALQELVLAIRDDAPSPAGDFRLRMDARVAAGFPPRRGARLRMPALAMKRPRLAALGVAASVLIAVVVAGSLGGRGAQRSTIPEGSTVAAGGGGSSSSSATAQSAPSAPHSLAQKKSAAREAAPTAASGSSGFDAAGKAASGAVLSSGTAVAPPIPNGGDVRGGQSRRVERSVGLVLAAPQGKLSQVGDQVVAVTDRYQGIVMSSTVTDTGNGQGSGYFDLRIPVGNLPAALRDLSSLADVQSRTENADDVTASFVSARTQIQELKAERKGLLRQLANATDVNQADAIKAQIRIVNGELNAATQALHRLSRRVHFATVSVTLTTKKHSSGGGGGGIGRGARDLRNSLVDSAVIALRVLGFAIPIALLIALLWAGNSWLTRRSREAALDARL